MRSLESTKCLSYIEEARCLKVNKRKRCCILLDIFIVVLKWCTVTQTWSSWTKKYLLGWTGC